jgi:hypothetical protein
MKYCLALLRNGLKAMTSFFARIGAVIVVSAALPPLRLRCRRAAARCAARRHARRAQARPW